MKTTLSKVNFGEYLHQLRLQRQLPLRTVADKLGIDISLLSKIEHGERFVQGHMLEKISVLFDLDFRSLQIQFLNQKLEDEFGAMPYIEEAMFQFLKTRNDNTIF
jgi:HTH-type transcriptional regulator, competence development regulator